MKPDTEISWYWEYLRKKPLHNWGTDAFLPCIFWQTHSGLLLQACTECFQVSKDCVLHHHFAKKEKWIIWPGAEKAQAGSYRTTEKEAWNMALSATCKTWYFLIPKVPSSVESSTVGWSFTSSRDKGCLPPSFSLESMHCSFPDGDNINLPVNYTLVKSFS